MQLGHIDITKSFKFTSSCEKTFFMQMEYRLLLILLLVNLAAGNFRRRVLLNMVSNDENRTAVCITGQTRSLSLNFRGEHIAYTHYSKPYKNLDGTIADNIANFIANETKDRGGGVDLYMIVPSDNAFNLTPFQRATACDMMYKYPLFGKRGERNHLYCLVMQEEEIYNIFVSNIPHVNSYTDGKSEFQKDVPLPLANRIAKEKFFRQIWALQYCNNIIKARVASGVVHYKYKMRIRPDLAFYPGSKIVKSLGPSTYERFHLSDDRTGIRPGSPCNSSIIITDYNAYPGGNQDTFGFGTSEDMDVRFNLYNAIVYEGLLTRMHASMTAKNISQYGFTPESVLEYHLFEHGICLKSDRVLRATIIRENHFSTYGANLQSIKTPLPADGGGVPSPMMADAFTSWVDVGPPVDWPFKKGQLVKFSPNDKRIFVYLNETFRLVPSWEAFVKHKYKVADVILVPAYWLEAVPVGSDID